MTGISKVPYVIERWSKMHDASGFTSDMESIRKYIQEQVHRDVSSHTTAVFVLVEPGQKFVRAYYSLSSVSIIFAGMPAAVQKKLPRNQETSGVLLGRLGVDKVFSLKQSTQLGKKARLGELLLIDAQCRSPVNAKEQGNSLMVIDAQMPTPEELAAGARDPLTFYTQYGFVPLSHNPRRVVKSMRAIEKEFATATS